MSVSLNDIGIGNGAILDLEVAPKLVDVARNENAKKKFTIAAAVAAATNGPDAGEIPVLDDEKIQEKLKKNLREFHGPLAPIVHDLLVSRPTEAGIRQLHNWEIIRRPTINDYKRWWIRANKIGTKPSRMSISTKKDDLSTDLFSSNAEFTEW